MDRTSEVLTLVRRVLLLVTVGVVALMLLANGCGDDGQGDPAAVTVPPTSVEVATTTTLPPPIMVVAPLETTVGSSVTFVVSQAVPTETVVFTVTFPNGRTFVGQPHIADATGMASAEYRTVGDPAGSYSVTANGSLGTTATSTFNLLPGPVVVTRTPATTAATATTTRAGAGTTTKGSSGASTTRAATTVPATTRAGATTAPTTRAAAGAAGVTTRVPVTTTVATTRAAATSR